MNKDDKHPPPRVGNESVFGFLWHLVWESVGVDYGNVCRKKKWVVACKCC